MQTRMPRIGIHASHEQIPPSRLLAAVQAAEAAGFDAAMCSDHFSPWSKRQGESGFAWSWLGAALEATSLSLGCVNAPGQRYHPAIIAQASATLAEMYPGRFWVALGSGEASNEHITGEPWPDKATRNARLRECVDVIRALHRGRDRRPRRARHRRPRAAVDAARRAAEADRRGGERRDGGPGGRVGRRAGDDQPAARAARARARRVPRGRRRGQAGLPAGPPVVGGARAGGARHRLRPVAHQRLPAADPVGPPHRRGVRRGRALRAPRGRAHGRARLRRPRRSTRSGCASSRTLGFDAIYLHHVGQELEPFIDAFGERVLPELR